MRPEAVRGIGDLPGREEAVEKGESLKRRPELHTAERPSEDRGRDGLISAGEYLYSKGREASQSQQS